MPQTSTIYIVCSDRSRNGKTLLARILVDHLLLNGGDPFCFDLSAPEGVLRSYFPGRTALIDLEDEASRQRLFTLLLGQTGRDYVIDVPGPQFVDFHEAADDARLVAAARDKGFRLCVLFVVDRDPSSLKAAVAVEDMLEPDLLVPVVNDAVGTALPAGVPGPVITLETIDDELNTIVAHRRFSFRAFLLGDEAAVPARLRVQLKNVLHGTFEGLRNLEPAMSLQQLHETEL